eukprot:8828591-Alexandrium_andersonii.AAC.1
MGRSSPEGVLQESRLRCRHKLKEPRALGGAWVSAGMIMHCLRACEVGVCRHSSRRDRRHNRCMDVLTPSTSRTLITNADTERSACSWALMRMRLCPPTFPR